MRYLRRDDVLYLHLRVVAASGGAHGVRDLEALESALAQPRQTFGGMELYPDLISKAAALCFFIVQNHPFVDGNKRTGQLALERFLLLNGFEIAAPVDDQERVILQLAAGQVSRDQLTTWVREYTMTRKRR